MSTLRQIRIDSQIATATNETMGYDPEDYESEAEQNHDHDFDAEIVGIDEKIAKDVFGDAAEEPDREIIDVNVEVDLQTEDIEFSEPFSLPNGPKSWANPNFKLARFYETYGAMPQEGIEVTATYNDDGFLRILLE